MKRYQYSYWKDKFLPWSVFIWKGHLTNWLWRTNKERRIRRDQAYLTYKTIYLNNYIPFIESLKPHNHIKPDNDNKNDKIFSLWLQGEDKAPHIVKACIGSAQRIFKENYILLSEDSLKKFIELPDYIISKWKNGQIGHAHFSDIVRVELLYRYGGYWCDATNYITGPIPDNIRNADFFMFITSPEFYPHMFVQNCFIRAKKGDPLLDMWRQLILEFWKYEEKADYYFLVQILFKLLVTYNKPARTLFEKMPKQYMDPTHLLWHRLGDSQFDIRIYESMCRKAFFQKCSYKIMKRSVQKILPGSMADFVINNKINK